MTFSLLTLVWTNTLTGIFWGIAGYYICHRGFKGVISDLNDARQDAKNLKNKLSAKTPV